MRHWGELTRRLAAPGALTLLAVLAWPQLRLALESSMSAHMLVQFPLLGWCGFILAGSLPERWIRRLEAWNRYGVSGLLACSLILSLLMIPRVLDLALVDMRIAALKWLALLACGAALRISWRPAGTLMQAFFLGNVLPMTAAAGQLYADAPVRLCNAYLLDDQARLGQGLVAIALALGLLWLGKLFWTLMQRDAAAGLPPDRARASAPRH